jgi:hypothetical protein
MRIPRHPTLIQRQRQGRLKQLAHVKPFVAASLVTLAVRCGRPGCRCADGPGHPSAYLTLKHAAKTVKVYVPKVYLPEVQQWVEEYHDVKQLLRDISELSLGWLRAQARIRRAQRPRASR